MTPSIDLDAYFNRIQWGGDVRPNYDILAGLLRAHMLHIPFENLDVLLGRGIRIDLDSIQNKLVRAHRGGYCFEHSTLLAAVLEQLGFQPVRQLARVTVLRPRTEMARTHMFLTVPLEAGTFVLDAGFGALAPRVPVPLMEGMPATIDSETHWMVRDASRWSLRAQVGDKPPVDAWVSTLEEEGPADFEMGNHFTATYPASPFRNQIMLRALTKDGRVSILNRNVTIVRAGTSHKIELADRTALRTLLADHFGFDLPEVEQLRVPDIPEWG